jgi:hypothetical protein
MSLSSPCLPTKLSSIACLSFRPRSKLPSAWKELLKWACRGRSASERASPSSASMPGRRTYQNTLGNLAALVRRSAGFLRWKKEIGGCFYLPCGSRRRALEEKPRQLCVAEARSLNHLSPHTTRDGLECHHVFRVHVIKQRVRHFIGLLRALRLCPVHSHGFNVGRVLRVLPELLLPRWPRLSPAEFVLGATILMACPAIPLRTVVLDSQPPILNQVIFAVHMKLSYHTKLWKANRGARARAIDFVPDVRASPQHWGVSCLCASPACPR